MPLLEVEQLVVEYPGPVRALDGLDLTLQRGEIVCMLGANGAGKTSLLKALCGLVLPKEGQSRWGTPNGQRPRLGVLLEGSRAFYWNLTGWENAAYFAALKGLPEDTLDEHLGELFRLVGLWDARNRLAGDYSSGMKKRLSLLIALLGEPDLLLLDEPTAGMDRVSVVEFEGYLQRIVQEEGIGILCTTHVLSFAFTVASRMVYLENGKLRDWEWSSLFGRHRRAVFLLAGAMPEEAMAQYQPYLQHFGQGRWQLEGATDDKEVFKALEELLAQQDLEVLQVYGVD